ncbi:MAG: hypothetical protein NTZ56_12705 [Acidobacteria bacterium]|nr:hypothetical protein [Acidobacteriota bacterium]
MTHPFLENEAAVEAFIGDWRSGQLPKAAWTHAAHVAACAYFALGQDVEGTFAVMKRGILDFNTAVGTANTRSSGYHETLTRLWASVIVEHVANAQCGTRFAAACSAVARFGEDRTLHLRYYSFDVAKDERARAEWVAPDVAGAG